MRWVGITNGYVRCLCSSSDEAKLDIGKGTYHAPPYLAPSLGRGILLDVLVAGKPYATRSSNSCAMVHALVHHHMASGKKATTAVGGTAACATAIKASHKNLPLHSMPMNLVNILVNETPTECSAAQAAGPPRGSQPDGTKEKSLLFVEKVK